MYFYLNKITIQYVLLQQTGCATDTDIQCFILKSGFPGMDIKSQWTSTHFQASTTLQCLWDLCHIQTPVLQRSQGLSVQVWPIFKKYTVMTHYIGKKQGKYF